MASALASEISRLEALTRELRIQHESAETIVQSGPPPIVFLVDDGATASRPLCRGPLQPAEPSAAMARALQEAEAIRARARERIATYDPAGAPRTAQQAAAWADNDAPSTLSVSLPASVGVRRDEVPPSSPARAARQSPRAARLWASQEDAVASPKPSRLMQPAIAPAESVELAREPARPASRLKPKPQPRRKPAAKPMPKPASPPAEPELKPEPALTEDARASGGCAAEGEVTVHGARRDRATRTRDAPARGGDAAGSGAAGSTKDASADDKRRKGAQHRVSGAAEPARVESVVSADIDVDADADDADTDAWEGGDSEEWDEAAAEEGREAEHDPYAEEYPDEEEELEACGVCGRRFRADVLARHSKICERVFARKRKKFGPDAAREAERARRVAAAELAEGGERKRRGTWRDAHLAFQHSIKAARGDADAEPPPPVADPRVPCPHCGRKFQPDVAERHIPHCFKAAKRAQIAGKKKSAGAPSAARGATAGR